jgi:hypothetical protein
MLKWIKRLVAGKELDELARWRINSMAARQFFAEFPDARDALVYVRARASGDFAEDFDMPLPELRDMMRRRRAVAPALSPAVADVLAERRRQIEEEGFTPERDDRYPDCEIACAAACYLAFTLSYPPGDPVRHWPWAKEWWKPSEDRRRNLVKGVALGLAEIERHDRAAAKLDSI